MEFIIKWMAETMERNQFTIQEMFRDLSTGGILKIVSGAAKSDIFANIAKTAAAIFICFYLITLLETALHDRYDTEALIKEFVLIGIVSYMVANSSVFVTSIGNACQSVVSVCTGASDSMVETALSNGKTNPHASTGLPYERDTDGDVVDKGGSSITDRSAYKSIKKEFKGKNFFVAALDAAWYAITSQIFTFIICVIARIALWTLKIELWIRTVMFPISVAMLGDDSWRGSGGRAIKNWIICYLQFGIVALAGNAYPKVLEISTGGGIMVGTFAAAFAVIGIVLRGNQLMSSIIGN